MPTWATAQTLSQPANIAAVTSPPHQANLKRTRQFGITQNWNAYESERKRSVTAKRKSVESRIQTSPSESHFVIQVAPAVATMMSFAILRIGTDAASARRTGMTIATRR